MKLLYGVQGTGNGHIARARALLPALMKRAEVDVLISGFDREVQLPIDPRFSFFGLGYIFGKKGGVDIFGSVLKARPIRFLRDLSALNLSSYDLIISDFEPLSAWGARRCGVPSLLLSHQASFLSPKVPRPPRRDFFVETIIKTYAPCEYGLGFHFEQYDSYIFTPIIRDEVRAITPTSSDHVTVYLPSYSDEFLSELFARIKSVRWRIFSKRAKIRTTRHNVEIFPIDQRVFLESFGSSRAVLCGAGFETPAEALFLKKHLAVVPMTNQYEQLCNAASLSRMGITVLKRLEGNSDCEIRHWIEQGLTPSHQFPDNLESCVDMVVDFNRLKEIAWKRTKENSPFLPPVSKL